MEYNRPALKTEAKRLIGKTSPSPLLVALVFALICYVIKSLSLKLTGVQVNVQDYYNALSSGNEALFAYADDILRHYHPGAFAVILDIAMKVLSLIVAFGFTMYVLKVIRNAPSGFGNLFDGFGLFMRIIVLELLIAVFVFLWSLLLFIPGIIASYKYRLARYLLIDNPEMSPLECIKESKRLMSGHKAELFMLDLSFLGWYILSAIPFVSVWVNPYTQITYALYYDYLRGKNGYTSPVYDNTVQQ